MQRGFTIIFLLALAISLTACSKLPPEQVVVLGQKALAEGNYEQAVPYLKQVTRANSENADAFYNLGMACLGNKQYRNAEKAFQEACNLSLKSADTAALEGLAVARRMQGNYEGAIQAYRSAMQKSSRKPGLLAGQAACQMDMGNFGQASILLKEALENDSRDPVVIFNYAVLCMSEVYFDQKAAARHFAMFLFSDRSEPYPAERKAAVAYLEKLNKSRPSTVRDKIDRFMMESQKAKTFEMKKLNILRAIEEDTSNPEIFSFYILCLEREIENGNKRLVGGPDKIRAHARILFPSDPRFAAQK